MSKKPTEPWVAEPHTLAKITILKTYLESWFSVLGTTRRRENMLYIDGFAGPGVYKGGESGSPVVASVAAAKISAMDRWIAGKIYCAFIEKELPLYSSLEERVEPFKAIDRLEITTYNTTFVEGYKSLRSQFPEFFKSRLPLFAFIDPFGATGAPFEIIGEILSSPTSEILINFDADGLARNFRAFLNGVVGADEILNQAFGDTTWQSLGFDKETNFKKLFPRFLQHYMGKLSSLPNVNFVYHFEMRDKADHHSYYLIFASQHPLGLGKMKEAMKTIDQTGDYKFSDANIGQGVLFRFDEVGEWADRLHSALKGKKITMPQANTEALVRTPFVNCKAILKQLEKDGKVQVFATEARKKFTFPEEKIKFIEFI
jgi:three-Cys-motif partner protein